MFNVNKVLKKIDDVVFDTPLIGVQQLMSRLQYFTGVKIGFVAKFCLTIHVGIMIFLYYQNFLVTKNPAVFVMIFLYLTMFVIYIAGLNRNVSADSHKFLNPLRQSTY